MNWDKQIINEWNELKFYYEFDSDFKQWRLFGSKMGFNNLIEIIRDYTNDPDNEPISEHIHLGPYEYLKIMSWNEPKISRDYIAGSFKDLLKLCDIIEAKLKIHNVGDIFKISDEYSLGNLATLVFFIMSDKFIPASIAFSEQQLSQNM